MAGWDEHMDPAGAPDQCAECRAAPGKDHANGCECGGVMVPEHEERYYVQVFRIGDNDAVFEDDDVVAYSTEDPVWFSLTTLWEGDRTVWMYPVSQVSEVRISKAT